MAYLKTIKDKSGKRFYYSLIQGVKHVGSKYISLDTDSKSVAKVHHADDSYFDTFYEFFLVEVVQLLVIVAFMILFCFLSEGLNTRFDKANDHLCVDKITFRLFS